MKKIAFLLLTLTLNIAFAQHEHAMSNAKLAHDASHRLGRLVDTSKINEVFLKDMKSLEVVAIPHNQHTDPAFNITAKAGSDSETVLTFDMMGKYLSNKLVNQTPSSDRPFDMDSSELIEASLHWLMSATDPNLDLTPFVGDLNKVVLNQQKNNDGTGQPIVTVSSSKTTKVLKVVLSAKGEMVSYSIVE